MARMPTAQLHNHPHRHPRPKIHQNRSTMKTTILAVILAASLSAAPARAACEAYEYAELKDMRKDDLETMYCEYEADMITFSDKAATALRTHFANTERTGIIENTDDFRQYISMLRQCAHETQRILRIFSAQIPLKSPRCPKK